jgi:HEAT repeat protein
MRAQTLALLPSEKSAKALIELTRVHSRYVRGHAAVALLQSAPGKKNAALVQKLHRSDPTDFVKIQTARALKLPRPLTRLAATADDPLDRAAALEALAQLRPPTAFATIQKQLAHSHPYVRQSALEALEKIDKQKSQPLARKLLKDPHPRVQLQAHKTLLPS